MNHAINEVIKSHTKLAILTAFAVVLVSIGTSYSLFQIDKKNTANQVIAVGTLDAHAMNVENLLLRDLYPKSASKITDADKKFSFTLTNPGDYDVNYEIVLNDVTESFLLNNSEYSEYHALNKDYYKYINFKVDGGEVQNLESARAGSKFVVLKGALTHGAGNDQDHYIQFFIDNKDTTTEGAPNDINGSILSLDISMVASASNNPIDKIIASVMTDNPDFDAVSPSHEIEDDIEETQNMSVYKDNYITYADSYTYNKETKKYTLTGIYEKPEKYSVISYNLEGKYVLQPTGSSDASMPNVTNVDKIYQILSATSDEVVYIDSDNFGLEETKKDSHVYSLPDDYGTSYYYRGNADNNYVKFGKNSLGQDMWWRIIRINGNKSVRMIYDGTQGYKNGTANNDRIALYSKYNVANTDAKYIGYMYNLADGTTTNKVMAQTNTESSLVKKALEDWYVLNIKNTGYESYLSDEVFCNDRSMPFSIDYAHGYGSEVSYFGAYNRLVNSDQPTFKCNMNTTISTDNDKFKVSNGNLNNPVGLITADEVEAAGGTWGVDNKSYYLYRGYGMWTMSPIRSGVNHANVFHVDNNGKLTEAGVQNNNGIAPVINLSATSGSLLKGSGTLEDPYHLD